MVLWVLDMKKRNNKSIICLSISVLLILFIVFLAIMKSEHQIITKENKFEITEVNKITFYNGDEKIIFSKTDVEFDEILSVFANKSINVNNAVHMRYKNYKIRLSNTFNYVDISPSLTNKNNDFAQIGNENRFTNSYCYININKEDNEVLFKCYENKAEKSWELVNDE